MKALKRTPKIVELIVVVMAAIFVFLYLFTPIGAKL